MSIQSDPSSSTTKAFLKVKPSWWIRLGSIVVFIFLVAYFLSENFLKSNITLIDLVELKIDRGEVNEEEVLASFNGNIEETYLSSGTEVLVGDTIFRFRTRKDIAFMKKLDSLMDPNQALEGYRFIDQLRQVDKSKLPFDFRENFLTYKNKTLKRLSTKIKAENKKAIATKLADNVRSQKNTQSLNESIPGFEKRLKEAEEAFQLEKNKYSKKDPSASLATLIKLRNVLDDNREYLRLRKLELRKEQAILRSNNAAIAYLQKQPRVSRLDTINFQREKIECYGLIQAWLDKSALTSNRNAKLVEVNENESFKVGDQLLMYKIENRPFEEKLSYYGSFPAQFYEEINVDSKILIEKKTDDSVETLEAIVLRKERVDSFSKTFVTYLIPKGKIDPQEEFILSANLKFLKSKNDFFSNLWANFY